MIYHIREEEKKEVKGAIVNMEDVLSEIEHLSERYNKSSTINIEKDGLIKLMKKGRYNYSDGKVLFSLNYSFEDEMTETIELKVIEKENFYIETSFRSDREDEGITELVLIDNVELMSLKSVIERIIFKLAEITMKVSYKYESDYLLRRDLEEVAQKLKWFGELTAEEVKEAVLSFSNLELKLELFKKGNSNVKFKLKEDLIGSGFKRYRSKKEIGNVVIDEYEDILQIVEGTNGRYYYEILLTKIDKYKGKEDKVKVYERHELTEYGFERLVRDVIPVYVATVESHIVGI